MARPFLARLGMLLVIFGCGLGFGLYLGGMRAVPESKARTTTSLSSGPFTDQAAQDRVEANTVLSDRVRELEKELAKQQEDRAAAIMADRLKLYKDGGPMFLFLRPFNDELKVSPSIVRFLNLTEAEQQALEEHLQQARDETRKLEQSKIQMTKQTGDSVSYEIPAYTDGAAIKEELKNRVIDDIGADRAEVFLASATSEFSNAFSNFGAEKLDITITRGPVGPGPAYQYSENLTAAGNGSSSGGSFTQLPKRFEGRSSFLCRPRCALPASPARPLAGFV